MSQTDECDFMKKSQLNKLIQQLTGKIEGKVHEVDWVKSYGFKGYEHEIIILICTNYTILVIPVQVLTHNLTRFLNLTKTSSKTMFY